MGFKNFYLGFKSFFGDCISSENNTTPTVLIIELNGLFYQGCHKLYSQYENMADLHKLKLQVLLFEQICLSFHSIIAEYQSAQTILLVVDGVPGLMKNVEQRQRRYKNSFENKYNGVFDLNCFSPGTKTLHYLTKYIDWYLRSKMTTDPMYRNKKIYFSNEKVAGEGEIKIINFIQRQCHATDPIMIYSSDSDLILLCLILTEFDITIARNSSHYGKEYLSVKRFRQEIYQQFSFDQVEQQQTFLDFFLLFTLLGNDYVPNSPCIYHFSILYENILPQYKQYRKHFVTGNKPYSLHLQNLCNFFVLLGKQEKKWLEEKYKAQSCSFFPDSIYLNQTVQGNQFDFLSYQQSFRSLNMITKDTVYQYLCTLQNMINMMFQHDFNWFYFFQYYKTPFLSDFAYTEEMETHVPSRLKQLQNPVFDPFFHLSIIIPPQSKCLLPKSLQRIFFDLKEFYPSYIEIDLTGKFKIWEGIVKLPIMKANMFLEYYTEKKVNLEPEEKRRNIVGRTFYYAHKHNYWEDFHSYYGTITNCRVKTLFLDI